MTKIRVLFVIALVVVSWSVFAQETIKPGTKAWTDLENTLRDADLKWLCQGNYYRPKRQDCVDLRAKYWDDQFFEMNPGPSGTQTKAQMVAGQTAGAKTYPDVVRGEGPNPTEFKLMAVYNNGTFAMAVDHTIFKIRFERGWKTRFRPCCTR